MKSCWGGWKSWRRLFGMTADGLLHRLAGISSTEEVLMGHPPRTRRADVSGDRGLNRLPRLPAVAR
jgi:hypothetical protein